MRRFSSLLTLVLLTLFLGALALPASGQFKGLKDKVKAKAQQKADEKIDKKIDEATEGSPTDEAETEGEAETPAEGESAPPASTGGTATAEDMTLYTKYDFVPGDKVIFFDDLSSDELGEFPSRWKLDEGVFEVAKQHGQPWILCTDEGKIRPKIPNGPLPDKYTVELDFYTKGGEAKGHWFFINWIDAEDREIGSFMIQDHDHTRLRIKDKDLASKQLAGYLKPGKHTMRVMATKTTMKCYIDQERVANVPAVEGFAPVSLQVHFDPWKDEPDNPMLGGAFRYAEGGKTLKQQLDEAGKIVTHGILFDSGSDRIKAESFKTLADIGGLLTENAALRLSIEGHTDADGADDANMTLSQKRAESVKAYLSGNYAIDAARLETKGWGESKAIDTNDTAEGKANNRRVELVKL
jgi:outer membrane protein OmpA-like peptidoglycan-associated protein